MDAATAKTDTAVRQAPALHGRLLDYTASGSGIAVIAPLCFGTTLAGLRNAGGQQAFLEAVGSGHQLIAYDQRGCDLGPTAAGEGWEQRGTDLWAVADAEGVERAVLYGVFDAGFTIAYAAAQHPERVLGLIFNLTPPAVGVPDPQQGLSEAVAEAWFGNTDRGDGQVAQAALEGLGIGAADAAALAAAWETAKYSPTGPEDMQLLRHADLRPIAPTLRTRALVIEPQRRPLVSGWGSALAALLPRAQLTHPARAGEMLGAIHGFLALIDIEEGHYASRLAADVSGAAGAAESAVAALRRIIVPVVDTLSSERAAEMACRLGRPQQAEIVLVHVVEIPLTRALSEETGPAREQGERALRLGQAIAARHGMQSRTRLQFERSATHGILRAANEEGADLIVMAIGEKRRPDPTEMSLTMREVLRHAPCEVLIDQGQRLGIGV